MIADYVIELTIPPNTPEARPVIKTISLGQGLIRFVDILFPGGTLGAVGVRLTEDGRQFLPQYGWLKDDGKNRTFTPMKRLEGPPFTLVIQGYSVASDWQHTIYFSLEVDR